MSADVSCPRLVKSLLGSDLLEVRPSEGNLYFTIAPENILKCMAMLAANKATLFESLTDCFAIDYTPFGGMLEIHYQLHSYKLDKNIFVTTSVPNSASVQSATPLFSNANWYEREIFEMFGINFTNHPNLRKLLRRDDE